MIQIRTRRRAAAPSGGLLFALVASVVVALCLLSACSDDSAESTTTTTRPTTSTSAAPRSTTTLPPDAAKPAWVLQVGTTADDAFTAVTSAADGPLATGWTEGALTRDTAPQVGGRPAGGRDVLTAAVSTDGTLRSASQQGSPQSEQASGISSARGSTVACGHTDGNLGRDPAGRDDAWCAPVDGTGRLGAAVQQGGSEEDRLAAVALTATGQQGYAAGSTGGLFPGATDTTSGTLGGGDALVWQIDSTGSPLWIRQFGTAANDAASAVATTGDDALVGGTTQGDLGGPARAVDGFLARFDPSGLPRWIRQFGSDANDSVTGVAAGGRRDRATETFVAVGGTDGTVPVADTGDRSGGTAAPTTTQGGSTAPRASAGGRDADAVAFDSAGTQVWTAQWGTAADDEAKAVAVDGVNVLVAGTTAGTMSTTGQPAAGGRDGFLSLLDLRSGETVWTIQFGSPGDEDVTGMTVGNGLIVVSGTTTGKMGDSAPAGGLDGFLIAYPLPQAGGSVGSSL